MNSPKRMNIGCRRAAILVTRSNTGNRIISATIYQTKENAASLETAFSFVFVQNEG